MAFSQCTAFWTAYALRPELSACRTEVGHRLLQKATVHQEQHSCAGGLHQGEDLCPPAAVAIEAGSMQHTVNLIFAVRMAD